MTYKEWSALIPVSLFHEDLQATIDGVQAGEFSQKFANSWIKRKGYLLNWKTLELTKIEDASND